MKQEYKNFGYMLAWVVVATMLLNPTFASQISSNLVKWFVAITSSDVKAENNLVWLDAGWKLPTDIIPAEAATAATWDAYNDHFCVAEAVHLDATTTTKIFECPTWFWKVHIKGGANIRWRNSIVVNWTIWNDGWVYDGDNRPTELLCCVRL